jgi:hypothetical protein
MAYLSSLWTIEEAHAWIMWRDPALVGRPINVDELDGDNLSASRDRKKETLLSLISEILSGRLRLQAREVCSGEVKWVSRTQLSNLEFHIADDIPGKLYGFRDKKTEVITWSEPMVPAADIVSVWCK